MSKKILDLIAAQFPGAVLRPVPLAAAAARYLGRDIEQERDVRPQVARQPPVQVLDTLDPEPAGAALLRLHQRPVRAGRTICRSLPPRGAEPTGTVHTPAVDQQDRQVGDRRAQARGRRPRRQVLQLAAPVEIADDDVEFPIAPEAEHAAVVIAA